MKTTRSSQGPAAQAQRKWLSGLWRLSPNLLLWAIAAPVLSGVLLLVQAWFLARTLDQAIRLHVPPHQLWGPMVTIALIIMMRAIVIWSGERAAASGSEQIKQTIRQRLFSRMLNKGPAWSKRTPTGELVVAILDHVQALDGYLQRFLPAAIAAVFLPLMFAIAVIPVDWIVALLFLFTAPLIPVFMALIGIRAEAANQKHQQELSRLSGVFADRIRGLFTLALLGRTQDEVNAVQSASHHLSQITMRVLRIAFLSSAVLELFAALGVAGVAVYIGLSYLGMLGTHFSGFTLQHGLFCLLLAPEVYNPLRQLAASYHDRAAAKAAVNALQQLYHSLPTSTEEHGELTQPLIEINTAKKEAKVLQAEQLSVQSPRGQLIMAPADFELYVGKPVVLYGASGVGKTSLLETLMGLRPYAAGKIIQYLEPEQRILIGQQPFMSLGTIADFLRSVAPEASNEQLWHALEQAQLAQEIKKMPLGLETSLGMRGHGISGGQAHRLALARLFLTQPRLLVLDEPTAYLDPTKRDQVMQAILDFSESRALIVATHDPEVADLFESKWLLRDQQLHITKGKQCEFGGS